MNNLKMCQIVVIAGCLLGIFSTCESSTFLTGVLQHPAYPGKCFEPTTKTPVKPGRSIDIPNICLQLTCQKDLRFSGAGCITEETLDPNCHEVLGELSLSYPHCCPRYQCRDEEGNNFII